MFCKTGGIQQVEYINIGHSKAGLEQGIDEKGYELIVPCSDGGASDTAEQKRGFPAKLYEDTDEEQPFERKLLMLVFMEKIPDDDACITGKKDERHVAVVGSGGALYQDGSCIAAEGLRKHRAAEPPQQDEESPFFQMAVFGKTEPYPCKIGEAVAHAHPQEPPKKAVSFADTAGMTDKVKDTVIYQHIKYTGEKSDECCHIIFLFQKKRRVDEQKNGVKQHISGKKFTLCDDFRHRSILL